MDEWARVLTHVCVCVCARVYVQLKKSFSATLLFYWAYLSHNIKR